MNLLIGLVVVIAGVVVNHIIKPPPHTNRRAMDSATARRVAQACYPDDTIDQINITSRARLWAGMGNIYRVSWKSENATRTLMVKYVHPRLASPNKLSIGDQRKLDSYLVEASFYEHYATKLLATNGVSLPPPPYHVERHLQDKAHPTIIIAMGELKTSSRSNQDTTHESVMKWLAQFHAATWNSTLDQLQPIGSYWHLETRPDEWDAMPRHGWQGRLKKAAKAIDQRLKRDALHCCVHGDTKDENLLYDNSGAVAFCDFQYSGRGPPTRDLAYYFCTAHVEQEEEREELIQLYFDQLLQHLGQRHQDLPTRQQLDDSLELAFCDFCRFMAGWGFWGYDLSGQVQATLDKLDGGKELETEQDYQEAVERVFG
jgi:Phosphotransferase enzyme family